MLVAENPIRMKIYIYRRVELRKKEGRREGKPEFGRTEREPVVAAKEGGVNLGDKGCLRKGRRQVPQHHLCPIQHT